MGRGISGAILAAAFVLLAACDGGGVAEQGDDSAFADCVEQAGLSLDGSEEWSEAEEREFLSQPAVLNCVVSDVPEDERADLLARVFPDDGGDDEAADEARVAKTEALVAYVSARADRPRDEVVADAAALMDAFGW